VTTFFDGEKAILICVPSTPLTKMFGGDGPWSHGALFPQLITQWNAILKCSMRKLHQFSNKTQKINTVRAI